MATPGSRTQSPRTETTVREAVLAAASENSLLLIKLGETEPAPGLLALHQQKLSQLKEDVADQNQVLEALKDQVDAKFKVHKKYNDSATRKLFYRATLMREKLDMKAEKGEKDYFSILGVQNQAEKRCAILNSELDQAELAEPELKKRAAEHGETHEKIDELYETLFAGPTPGFANEDSLESKFYIARGAHESVRQKIISARRAANALKQATRSISRAERKLDEAAFDARNSFFVFDEAAAGVEAMREHVDYALASLLEASDIVRPNSQDVQTVVSKTNQVLQAVKLAGPPASNRQSYETTIRTLRTQLDGAKEHVKDFISLLAAREQVGLEEIRKTARTLEDSRQALHQSRMAIFEQVAGFGEAAPSYLECCDRADNLCELPPPPPPLEDEEESNVVEDERNEEVVSSVLPDYDDAIGVVERVDEEERIVSPLETRSTGKGHQQARPHEHTTHQYQH